jgi:glycosyltransferase involved in cell wall biosynthesis
MPHHDVLLMAYIAAKLSGSKLVVDLRDPPEYLLYKSKGFSHIVYTILIKLNYMLMRKADLVVTVTSGLAKLLAKHGLRANLLINGADISIFQPQFNNNIRERLRLSEDKVVLVFNGYLGDYYDPIPLLRAIAKLPGEYKERIVLLVIGGFNNSSYARKFLQIAKELQLSNNIKILRPILEERVLAEVLSAGDVGVITRIDSELFDLLVPAKFYEYLACGLPIIALVRRGSEVWEYIVKWGIGFVCDPDDYNCIITALRNIFDKNIMRNIKVNVLSMRPYIDRRRVAEKLFSLLYESLKHKGGNCI